MLYAQFFHKLVSRSSAAGSHILLAAAHGFHRCLMVLLFPREVIGQHFVQGFGGILSVTLCVLFQLRFAFRFHRHHFHKHFISL